ncbi:SRPBCC family protein [Asanoa sp. WMMD1127]|uniref:SRPBCC family protein n=1 Tax=Asanoa sp. WMMD1127 TaxID=3016107 RepID=UPI002415F79A|nr:SRPBCC family protein [Asanoa sp. WMMD1127]MDG4821962.1 SRPBCC family protein [Asanoa sp. WMMD1127]
MKSYEPSPLADVRAEQAIDGRWTLVFVRDFPHPPTRVWRALTEPAELTEWAPYTADRNLSTLGPAKLTMIDGEERVDIPVEVTDVDPERALVYTWDTDLLRWQLTPTAIGTRLTLHHTVNDPSWISQVAAGWHICLDVADHLLADDPIGPIRGNAARAYGWEPLRDAYATKLDIPTEDNA